MKTYYQRAKKEILLLLAATAFVSSAGGAAAARTPDHSAGVRIGPEHSFRPAAGWQILQDQRQGQCFLETTLDNGFILALEGNPQNLKTLSIDVRQPAFQKGAALPVSVIIPGQAQASLQGVSVSSETLFVDFRGQAGLYARMKEAGVMDLQIGSNEFRFYLTGFAAASAQFEACLGGRPQVIEAAAPQTIPQNIEPAAIMADPENLDGRAPPPPTCSLAVPSPAERAAAKGYHEELAHIMPDEDDYKVPIQEIVPGREPVEVREISKPLAVAPRSAPGRKRLTEMLAEEMQRQNAAMQSGEAIDTYAEHEITGAPLYAPLVKKGSAEEKALLAIIEGGEAAGPDQQLLEAPTGGEVIINPEPLREGEAEKPAPQTREIRSPAPTINRQRTTLDVDLTEVGAPAQPLQAPKPEKTWLETLQEKSLSDPDASPAAEARPEPLNLEAENKTEDTFIKPKASAAPAPVPMPEMAEDDPKLRVLNSQLEMMRAENEELRNELNFALEQGKTEVRTIASENWNLEKSTAQYNEALRQIDRLGAQLRKERAACAAEVKELETMLFDPQLTESSQLARLAQLEEELAEAESKLEQQRQTYEARIKLLQQQAAVR